MVTKPKNSNGDKNQKPQIVTPHKNSNYDKTQIVTKKTQKLNLRQDSKTQIVMILEL